MKITWSLIACLSTLVMVNTARVERIGNPLKASVSGVDVPGTIFLLNDVVLTEGVVFAYSAFFRSDSAVRFQIWRPVENATEKRSHQLVAETRVIPSILEAREDIYLVGKFADGCPRIRTGDRLGVFLEEAPGSVAYAFDASDPMALGYTYKNLSNLVNVDDTIGFDSLTFPYDFSAAAHIDTDLSQYDPNVAFPPCPKQLLIPDYETITLPSTTPSPPPTGRPGATGATGSQGKAGATGGLGAIGSTGPEGKIGANGATGDQGEIGATGPVGKIGATGSTGEVGATGVAGPKGDKGDMGPRGQAGQPGEIIYVGEKNFTDYIASPVSKPGGDSNSLMVLVIMIWLAIVTIIMLMLIVVMIIRKNRNKDLLTGKGHGQNVHMPNMWPDITITGPNEDGDNVSIPQSWVSTMKDDAYKTYKSECVSHDGDHRKSVLTYENEMQSSTLNLNDDDHIQPEFQSLPRRQK